MLHPILMRAALFAAIWWALTEGARKGWGLGLVTIVLAVWLGFLLQPAEPGRHGISLARLPRFLAFFLFRSIKGGVQVAGMALRPTLDLQPAILEIHLRLPEEAARVFLASTLSLLPGTLSTGLDGSRLHLHVLDRRMPIERDVRNAEAKVAHLFQMDLP